MATLTTSGAGRGRRKQAKPQRKVDADPGPVPEDPPNTSRPGLSSSTIVMSPDNNHNEIAETSDSLHKIMNGSIHIQGDVPEEVPEASRLGVIKQVKSGGTPEDLDGDSDKAAIGEDISEDDDKIIEYMRRSDTAVIFPEQVGTQEANDVPGALNGLKPEPEELSPGQEYFMKCPQCQKGYQTYQGLKDHIESSHGDLLSIENGSVSSNPLSPTPLTGPGGPYACSQCSASFANKDQLEKHELLHSPNPQVFCKVCNKTFANVYRLQRHMISHDESAVLRKFKCTECDKAFKFKHHLKEHIRIHSGEKPFECGNCGKRFSHSGSYSSHMTSKKCLVMNLKLGRTRPPTASLDKSSPSQTRGPKRNSLNNNLTSSPNQNGMFPILPKYTDAAAAAALFNPFYMNPPNMPMPPYSIPTIGEFLEKLQRVSPQTSGISISEHEDRKMVESDGELDKTKSTSCGDLVMDEEEIDVKEEHEEKQSGDLEAVKRILETVNVSVTKQFLQANMQKYSSDTSDCNSVASAQSPQQIFNCNTCKRTFSSQNYLEEHECDSSEVKSEGLAAKLEDAVTTKSENDAHNGSYSGNSDEEYEKHHNDEEIDNERVATTDQLSDDGRKVRVRSLISDEQLKVLKDNYGINPRPKREDLMRIAEQIGFPVRVVQVWFQNTRARDRREGRLIQIPYNQPRFPTQTTQYLLPPTQYSEQPLDLSIRKDSNPSPASSPWSSPRPASIHHSDSEDVVNLSHKSSRSPTPFQHSSYQNYQNSNCSSELRRSPSPIDFKNGQSRLAQILAQPSHKLHPIPGMSLVPMDRLMQFGNQELQNFSQMITNLSPSNKRCWSDDGDATQESVDDEMNSKRKVGQLVMKSLGSPMLGNQEEAEGQFGCDQCDKSFSKQSSLARHKYEHSGQRPHKCDECPKAFKHKHHLTEHKRLHSGEKPFQCSKCLKRFSHSGSYSQHMNHRYSYCKPYRE